jgi:energy-coupling factor transporter transmembrane protein EcfT
MEKILPHEPTLAEQIISVFIEAGWAISLIIFLSSLIVTFYRITKRKKLSKQIKMTLILSFFITLFWILLLFNSYVRWERIIPVI